MALRYKRYVSGPQTSTFSRKLAPGQRSGFYTFMLRCLVALALAASAEAFSRRNNGSLLEDAVELPSSLVDVVEAAEKPPSVFVAVFSAQSNMLRRKSLRQAMPQASIEPGTVTMKFVVCNQSEEGGNDTTAIEDQHEGDMLMIGCREGWKKGMLTRKLIMVMQHFKQYYAKDHQFFMRVDDDTFVAWRRLRTALQVRNTSQLYYLGAVVPAGRVVNRDKTSPWYQPMDTYKANQYPVYMQKGPGYIVSAEVVVGILAHNISQTRVLTNEDQAMGVWVDLLKHHNFKIRYHNLPNSEGRPPSEVLWQDYHPILHHRLKGDYISCLTAMDQRDDPLAPTSDCFTDSMFVAIFSARNDDSKLRRVHVRTMLLNADGGAGRIVPKFVMCSEKADRENPKVDGELHAEAAREGDMLFVPCVEGYGRQLLTKKLLLAMEAYRDQYRDMALFMKLDDDTFVSWRRLKRFIANQWGTSNGYMGTPAPEGFKVNRNPNSTWYQPRESWPNETYPSTMEGGPGYIIGGELVRRILADGIAAQHILSNEDQAAGVWIDILKQRGSYINYITLPGTDGYRPQFDTCFGAWKDYPFLMHHHLKPQIVSCLARLDQMNNDTEVIDDCFDDCQRFTAIALKAKLETISSKVKETMTKMQVLDSELQEMVRVGNWLSTKVAEAPGPY